MNIINWYGLAFMAIILIPNIAFAIRCKDDYENPKHSLNPVQIGYICCNVVFSLGKCASRIKRGRIRTPIMWTSVREWRSADGLAAKYSKHSV